MKRGTKSTLVAACAAGALMMAGGASASLNVFQTFTGTLGVSTDGLGAASQSGNITANVPVGATVVAAYLYSAVFFDLTPPTGTLAGQNVNYSTQLGTQGFLEASRADVTSILAPLINGGPGGAYTFAVTEGGSTSGEALVLVYSLPTLAVSTIGILDGFSATGGDDSSISFTSALHPGDAGFQAEMRVGIQHSCCSQESTITVNGQTLTDVAGNNDDSDDGSVDNSNLLTMGGDDDPFTVASPGLPAGDYSSDHERYNLSPFINDGDTSIHIHTVNPSSDDNIFLEVFQVTGEGVVHGGGGVPEPATWAMMLMGFFGLGATLRRRRAVTA